MNWFPIMGLLFTFFQADHFLSKMQALKDRLSAFYYNPNFMEISVLKLIQSLITIIHPQQDLHLNKNFYTKNNTNSFYLLNIFLFL